MTADEIDAATIEINNRMNEGDGGAFKLVEFVPYDGMAAQEHHPKIVVAGDLDGIRVVSLKRGQGLHPFRIGLHHEEEVGLAVPEIGEDFLVRAI